MVLTLAQSHTANKWLNLNSIILSLLAQKSKLPPLYPRRHFSTPKALLVDVFPQAQKILFLNYIPFPSGHKPMQTLTCRSVQNDLEIPDSLRS